MTDNPFGMPSPKLSPSWGHVPHWYMPLRDRKVIVEQRRHAAPRGWSAVASRTSIRPAWPFRMGSSPWRPGLSETRKEQLRRQGAAAAATRSVDQKHGQQSETNGVPATTLPASTAEEKNTTDSGGGEESA
ncbi:MAG: hypothetical protein NTU78_05365 [Alphaproteobacteria bacterium]|nr:hypothetical protein [Alphaproteobacteria bacterium]